MKKGRSTALSNAVLSETIGFAFAVLALFIVLSFSPEQAHSGDRGLHSSRDHPQWTDADGGSTDSKPLCGTALPKFEIWYRSKFVFTFQEAGVLYARLYHCAQPRIQHPWTPRPDGTALADIENGGKFYRVHIPKEFISKSIAHIERMLEERNARYLFALDLDHGHFYVPRVKFETVYNPLWVQSGMGRFLEALLADERLKVVFHAQELISPRIPPRTFIGTYDKKATLLATDGSPPRSLLSVLGEDYGAYSFAFMAHPLGAFELKNGTHLDFSFHDWMKFWPTDYLRQLGVILTDAAPYP
jgi:hypothetical protein